MGKEWAVLSPDEKQDLLFEKWLAPANTVFTSTETQRLYRERVTRIKAAIRLQKPDRVPIMPAIGFLPAYYAGTTPRDVMYDYDQLFRAWRKFTLDFAPDVHTGIANPGSGHLFDILDYKLYNWPGHGIAPEFSYQALEGEYVKADEYDALLQDPSDFFRRVYLPRVLGAFAPFSELPPLTYILELPTTGPNLAAYGLPVMQEALQKLAEAGREALKWIGYVGRFNQEMASAGFPASFAGFTKAPFDTIGDTLRGTKGIMMDMYRQPAQLLKALDVITPIMINMGVSATRANGNPLIFIPLHKGADGFLSDKQFRTFYWPSFKKLLLGLIAEGCVPCCFAEGGYNSRLEIIKDIPKAKTVWLFDATDMSRAKQILGDTACIAGNVPISLLSVGTTRDVEDYVKNLIDIAGKGGGFIMANGAVMDRVKPENVHAMIDLTKEYGVYK
jgi:hypothetical protein